MKLLLFILIIYNFCFLFSYDKDKLIFVVIHFRHGARAPQKINDSFIDLVGEKWENPGELTGVGQRIHYILGLRNRKRYIEDNKFLSKRFDPHEILIYSTHYNRTIVSCASHLQGLYPQNIEGEKNLNEKQKNSSIPRVDCSDSYIQNKINDLNDNALPNSMMLAPIKMLYHTERKAIVFDQDGCEIKREEIKKINLESKSLESSQILSNFTNEFNEKYKTNLNKFFGDFKNYDIDDIDKICDAFISSYADGRDLTEFKNTEINFEEFEEICLKYNKFNYIYHYAGDKEKVLPHVETSKIMTEFIHYMKERIDADIKDEKIEEKFKDYSRPKMLMFSGHDTTVSSHQVFLIEAFGFNYSDYIYPQFGDQISFEVTRKNDGPKSNYSDYTVHYFFNDDEIYNITFNEFLEKIEPHIWSEQKINDFCQFNKINDSLHNFNFNKKTDNAKTTYKALTIILSILCALLLISTIFLAIKLLRKPKYSTPVLSSSTTKI